MYHPVKCDSLRAVYLILIMCVCMCTLACAWSLSMAANIVRTCSLDLTPKNEVPMVTRGEVAHKATEFLVFLAV